MATKKQATAARKNIRKAQKKWRSMTSRQHALAQPEGRARAKVGTKGGGEYYRIEVRPKKEFVTFRYHDIGKKGHIERLAGKRPSGSWATVAWLIGKEDAKKKGKGLAPLTADARQLLAKLGSKPKLLKGDIFEAHDRPNVPERAKPTAAQKRARSVNIEKAQKARWK